jgi:fatty acid amide hydrolase 2
MPPLTERSALALAAAIRAGEVSAREVVEDHIERYERFHARVNAIVVPRFDEARAEADAADARIAAADPDDVPPPLLGVPFTAKEMFAVRGMPHSGGLVARREVRADTTAPLVQRLLDAGAILLGLTNPSELSLWIESNNRVYGRTSNPYDLARTAGGSSGGEAAAVGCGGSPIGVGTDTGGSTRIPAFFCGVFAHKPSLGLVPHTGGYPPIHGDTKRMVTYGPLARRAEDLMPVLRAISGPDGVDPLVGEVELGDPAEVSLDGLPVLVSERAFVQPMARELLGARERAAGALAAAGARVERLALPQMRRTFEPALATLGDGGKASLLAILEEAGEAPMTLRSALRRGGDHTLPVRLVALIEILGRRSLTRRAPRAIARGRDFAEELAGTIGDGVLLHPPFRAWPGATGARPAACCSRSPPRCSTWPGCR